MSAKLCSSIPREFSRASEFDIFFATENVPKIQRLFDPRELPASFNDISKCKTNFFFGFFFDGKKNNYILAGKNKTHSNIARLYDCYPGLSVPGVLPKQTDWEYNPPRYTHFFRTYIPGVASPFNEVNDSGQGLDLQGGAAPGYLGEARIVWALLQAINNVHRYFLKAPLLTPQETATFISSVVLDKKSRRQMTLSPGELPPDDIRSADKRTRQAFEKVLDRLHSAVTQHSANEKTDCRIPGSISVDALAWRATLMSGGV